MTNLDYDDDLRTDAEALGISREQPPTEAAPETVSVSAPPPSASADIEIAIRTAQIVYGLTSCRHSEYFYQWCADFLEGNVSTGGAKELLQLLIKERNSYEPCMHLARHAERYVYAERLSKRTHAVVCAQLALRAVLTGKPQWIERSLWRASKADGDNRRDPLTRSPLGE